MVGMSPFSSYGTQAQGFVPTPQSFVGQSPYSLQPQQQILQLLQIVPQQLQTLQQLQYVQQHQLQQLTQFIPVQLAQLQQLVQIVLQHLQTQQPIGQIAGIGNYGLAAPWGVTPQQFGNQPPQIM